MKHVGSALRADSPNAGKVPGTDNLGNSPSHV